MCLACPALEVEVIWTRENSNLRLDGRVGDIIIHQVNPMCMRCSLLLMMAVSYIAYSTAQGRIEYIGHLRISSIATLIAAPNGQGLESDKWIT